MKVYRSLTSNGYDMTADGGVGEARIQGEEEEKGNKLKYTGRGVFTEAMDIIQGVGGRQDLYVPVRGGLPAISLD